MPKALKIFRELSPFSKFVSFKLETEISLLEGKVLSSFQKYGMQAIIANLLQTRKNEVFIYYFTSENYSNSLNKNFNY